MRGCYLTPLADGVGVTGKETRPTRQSQSSQLRELVTMIIGSRLSACRAASCCVAV
jgi:hypothetical protein